MDDEDRANKSVPVEKNFKFCSIGTNGDEHEPDIIIYIQVIYHLFGIKSTYLSLHCD